MGQKEYILCMGGLEIRNDWRLDCCRLKMAIKSLVLLLLRSGICFPSLWFFSMTALPTEWQKQHWAIYGTNLEKEMAIANQFPETWATMEEVCYVRKLYKFTEITWERDQMAPHSHLFPSMHQVSELRHLASSKPVHLPTKIQPVILVDTPWSRRISWLRLPQISVLQNCEI